MLRLCGVHSTPVLIGHSFAMLGRRIATARLCLGTLPGFRGCSCGGLWPCNAGVACAGAGIHLLAASSAACPAQFPYPILNRLPWPWGFIGFVAAG